MYVLKKDLFQTISGRHGISISIQNSDKRLFTEGRALISHTKIRLDGVFHTNIKKHMDECWDLTKNTIVLSKITLCTNSERFPT